MSNVATKLESLEVTSPDGARVGLGPGPLLAVSQVAGDHADPEEILRALETLVN